MEVTAGFEPAHQGFADPCLGQLGYVTGFPKIDQGAKNQAFLLI